MILLTPGPVSTHPMTRAAAAQDYAPWDMDFRAVLARVRDRLLAIAGGQGDEHAVLPLAGSGHFAVEAAIRTFVPAGRRLMVIRSGDYASRIVRLGTEAGCDVVSFELGGALHVDPQALEAALRADPAITHLAVVYSETSTGLIHDAPALAKVAGACGRRVLIDAISAFGALPLHIARLPMVDCVVLTANKCLEGIPGISLSVARIDSLLAGRNRARSWSLDLADLYQHTLKWGPGSHRYTPSPQAIAALDTALDLLEQEGGPAARLSRYHGNMGALCSGVQSLGLELVLPIAQQGPIVVNVRAPSDPAWDLQHFVDLLKRRGFLISNFFNTPDPSFRVGCIGALTVDTMRDAVGAMSESLQSLGIRHRRAA